MFMSNNTNALLRLPRQIKPTDSSNFSIIVNSGLIGMADGKSKSDIRNVVVVANAFDHHRALALLSDGNDA